MASELLIAKWQHILNNNISTPNHANAKERLQAYICTLGSGRSFNEPAQDYFERKGYTDFINWALEQVNK